MVFLTSNRGSVRDYLPSKVDKNILETLLDAAVHAPTAMHEEPCAFVIIQNKDLLTRLSDTAKALVRNEAHDFNKVDIFADTPVFPRQMLQNRANFGHHKYSRR